MKKKILIAGVIILLIAVIAFGAVYGVNYHKRKVIREYADVVSIYFETAKNGNNQLMNIAGVYESFEGGFPFESAYEEVEEDVGLYNGVSYDIQKAYETVILQEVKYNEMHTIKNIVEKHFEEYKIFEGKILNESEANYGGNYGSVYKEWQRPFADVHNELRKVLALYR